MSKRFIVPSSLLLALTLAGCGAQKGSTEIKYESDSPGMNLSEATRTGTYALYTMTDLTPRVVRQVHEGDRLGFRKLDGGQVEAIAGDYTTTLDSKTIRAYWKYQGNK